MMKRKNKHSLNAFMPYLWAYKLELFLAMILGIVSGLTAVLMTRYIGYGIDTMVGQANVNFGTLRHILFLLAGILLVTASSQWLIQRLSNRIAYQSVAQLRKKAFAQLNRLPLNYYDRTPHGDIVSRFTNDMDNISVACAAVFNQVFTGLTMVILALVFMVQLSVKMTLVVLVATPVIFLVNWLVATASQKSFRTQQKTVGALSGFVSEMVSGQKVVKAFQQENHVQTRFEAYNQDLYVSGQKAQFASSLTNPLSRFIDHLTYLTIGLVGGLLILRGDSTVTVGVVSSFTIYASQFSKPFIELSGITTQIQTALAGLERTQELFNQPVETPDAANALTLTHVNGQVSFENVAFSYTPNRPLIKNFNLNVSPGQTIAIVGKTGAGKSTLVNLLLRFYEIDAGEIRIDGTNIKAITKDSLRRNFGMVLQETWLFDSTIRENLIYGNPYATDAQIDHALQKTYMYDFVHRLPDGLETIIGSSGIKISDGQRQLLTIARTMLSEPPMLILDEATSSVDTLTERNIQRAFLQMMKGKTSFVIAHRLATIKTADQILVMDQGQIVEIGTHEELLRNSHGRYHALYEAQFKQQVEK